MKGEPGPGHFGGIVSYWGLGFRVCLFSGFRVWGLVCLLRLGLRGLNGESTGKETANAMESGPRIPPKQWFPLSCPLCQ